MVTINTGFQDVGKLKFWKACFAELFGTMFFLLGTCLVCLPWSHGANNDRSSDNLEIGLGIGLSITTSAIMIGHVSGGHLNPAVSLGCIFAGRISVLQGLLYIPSQVVGGIAGAAIAYGLTPASQRSSLGQVALHPDVTEAQGFGLELMFTFVLVFFVLSITDPKKKTETYGTVLGIGVCIWVIHLLLVPMTGCGINPARAIAPAIIMNGATSWNGHWVYWIGPIVGAPLAAFFYCLVLGHEKESKADETENTA